MSVQNSSNKSTSSKSTFATGIILMLIGVGLLIAQFVSLMAFFPLLLGLIFLAAGVLTRKAGLLIPGGIIGGTGLGILMIDRQWIITENGMERGGLFLIAMSAGWVAITVLSKLFTDETQVWPLFPAAGMILVGALELMGETGLNILQLLGQYWPVILVVIGAGMLINIGRTRKQV